MRAKTLKEIAAKYGVKPATLSKDIAAIPELANIRRPIRLLYPAQIEIIIKTFGTLDDV